MQRDADEFGRCGINKWLAKTGLDDMQLGLQIEFSVFVAQEQKRIHGPTVDRC